MLHNCLRLDWSKLDLKQHHIDSDKLRNWFIKKKKKSTALFNFIKPIPVTAAPVLCSFPKYIIKSAKHTVFTLCVLAVRKNMQFSDMQLNGP